MRALKRTMKLLWERVWILWAGSLPMCALAAAALCALPWGLWEIARARGVGGAEEARSILTFCENLALRPLMCAVMAGALVRRWDNLSLSPRKMLPQIQKWLWKLWSTGIAAWFIAVALGTALRLVPALIGLLATLLGWIPGLGQALSGLKTGASAVVSWTELFLMHGVALWGMMPIWSDGNWGRPQMTQALRWIWGGRPDTFWGAGVMALGWCACLSVRAALPDMGVWNALIAALRALLLPLSASAVGCLLLSERDRQEGARLRIYEEE